MSMTVKELLNRAHSQKLNYRDELVQVMRLNIEVVDDLVAEAKRLSSAKKKEESNRLLDIAQKVLESNKRLQNTVVQVLPKLG